MTRLPRWQNAVLPVPVRFRDALQQDRSLDGTTKGVLVFLAQHYPVIQVGVRALAAESGRSERQVRISLEKARSSGWIKRTYYGGHGHGADEYELIIRPPGKKI
jgi:hypothetical protein